MTRLPEHKAPGLRRAEIGECRMLVDPAKSRRLREWASDRNSGIPKPPDNAGVKSENPNELPAGVLKELQQIQRIIDDEIARIMGLLPDGRKNSLFKLRFGSLEEIRAMEVRAIFRLLKLDYRHANLDRLQKINYYGEKVF